jgi:hypothetical protein
MPVRIRIIRKTGLGTPLNVWVAKVYDGSAAKKSEKFFDRREKGKIDFNETSVLEVQTRRKFRKQERAYGECLGSQRRRRTW